MRIFISEITVV